MKSKRPLDWAYPQARKTSCSVHLRRVKFSCTIFLIIVTVKSFPRTVLYRSIIPANGLRMSGRVALGSSPSSVLPVLLVVRFVPFAEIQESTTTIGRKKRNINLLPSITAVCSITRVLPRFLWPAQDRSCRYVIRNGQAEPRSSETGFAMVTFRR